MGIKYGILTLTLISMSTYKIILTMILSIINKPNLVISFALLVYFAFMYLDFFNYYYWFFFLSYFPPFILCVWNAVFIEIAS